MKSCEVCSKPITKKTNESRGYFYTKRYCSRNCASKAPLSNETRKRLSESHKGKVQSVETRKRNRESQIRRIEKGVHNRWRGGISPINQKIRRSLEYRIWREAVFKRDNYTCRFCGKRGGTIHADHIKQFAYYPELRFAIDNGRTLCKACHLSTDTYGKSL